MIIPTLPAYMRCDHESPDGGCDAELPVSLVLLLTGGFAFRPPPDGKSWQVGAGPAGQFICFCPKHKQTVVKPPTELAIALGAKH